MHAIQKIMYQYPAFAVWLTIIATFFIIPVLGSYLISVIMRQTTSKLGGKVYLAWLGIIIHELSHAGVALIFGHKIQKISLLQHADGNGTLGYVQHTWNPKSLYQRMGNFFIGIAPIFGIGASAYLVTWLLWPTLLQGDFHLPSPWWLALIWAYLFLTLLFGIDLSSADWQGAQSGILVYLLFLTISSIFIIILHVQISNIEQFILIPELIFFGILLGLGILIRLIVAILR
ncbi:MAG: hypothetical protein LBT37_07625 [Lactobacillaceae bacterium]|nr:hypothetical protein [Lactobacillaceae bacterium]